jgi:hypothetical protein
MCIIGTCGLQRSGSPGFECRWTGVLGMEWIMSNGNMHLLFLEVLALSGVSRQGAIVVPFLFGAKLLLYSSLASQPL